jgi:ABC-type multidrug transport system ATPase subunit
MQLPVAPGRTVTVGRNGGPADIQVDGPDVALHHADLRKRDGQLHVRDRSRGPGVMVRSHRAALAKLNPGEDFEIGRHRFGVLPDGVCVDPRDGPVAVVCENLAARYRGHPEGAGLQGISFSLPAGGVLAVVGPSGAGKSTLCRALLGEMEDTSGSASVDGVQLAHRGQPTHLVSFVPQPEAMALDLTVRESLECVARLRLARDATAAELRARVDQVIHDLTLHDQAGQRIGSLSGGQRKRVSVAMELLSEPRLLILDEPTSGLDEGLDRQMMDLLQDVAAGERAVIVVTHSTANLDRADRIVAVNGEGGLGFFGSPSGLLAAFATSSYAAVMDRLRQGESAASDLPCEPAPPPSGPLPPRLPQLRSRTRVLIGRELLRLRNRQGARQLSQHLLAAPVAVAALSALASSEGLAHDNADRTRVLSVLFICSAFFASALSFSSIVADQDMIMREARWGIPSASVITSRAAILCVFGAVQGLLTAGLFSLTRPLYDGGVPMPAGHGPLPAWVTVATSLVLLDVACVSLGLLLSTVSNSLQQAVLGLMTSAVTQVVLSGTLISLGGDGVGRRVLQAISVLVPTRWAVSALGADAGLNLPLDTPTPPQTPQQGPDPWWTHDTPHVLGGWVALVVLATGFLIAARQRLKARQLSRL